MFKLLRRLIILAILVGVLLYAKNIIAKVAIEKGVKSATGIGIEIGNLDVGIKDTYVDIKNLHLLNPEEFPGKTMFEAPEIFVDYNLGAAFKGKIHLEEIRIDFDKLIVVKNKQGDLNINAIKIEKKPDEKEKQEEKTEKKEQTKKAKVPEFQIDHLLLKVDKLVLKDYSGSGDPRIEEVKIGLNEKFENIDSTQELIKIILQKTLTKAALANWGDFNIDIIKDAAAKMAVQSVTDKLKDFTDKIKLPFGN